jgi:hypothetical protein
VVLFCMSAAVFMNELVYFCVAFLLLHIKRFYDIVACPLKARTV